MSCGPLLEASYKRIHCIFRGSAGWVASWLTQPEIEAESLCILASPIFRAPARVYSSRVTAGGSCLAHPVNPESKTPRPKSFPQPASVRAMHSSRILERISHTPYPNSPRRGDQKQAGATAAAAATGTGTLSGTGGTAAGTATGFGETPGPGDYDIEASWVP